VEDGVVKALAEKDSTFAEDMLPTNVEFFPYPGYLLQKRHRLHDKDISLILDTNQKMRGGKQ